nr:FIST C-terminal domain-containing protein [uncultured Marinifilum sp.]
MFFENPNSDMLLSAIRQLKNLNHKNALILVGEECKISPQEIVSSFNHHNLNLVGGIFPKVIFNKEISSKGMIIKEVDMEVFPIYFETPDHFSEQFSDYQDNKFTTAFTLTAGFSSAVADHLRTLYTHLGNEVDFFGGGVGRTIENPDGILFNNDGIYQKGTIVVFFNSKTKMYAKHGWTKSEGPFIVTKASKNLILELNWENAFEVYQKCLKESKNINITKENFVSYSMDYPFGIYKEGREYIVRDPIKLSDKGYLTCVGNIPENSLVDLLSMKHDELKKLPKELVENCKFEGDNHPDILLFDCISRVNHLKENFSVELNGIYSELKNIYPSKDLEGALSVGEIFSNGEGYLEFLNKSIVLGCYY